MKYCFQPAFVTMTTFLYCWLRSAQFFFFIFLSSSHLSEDLSLSHVNCQPTRVQLWFQKDQTHQDLITFIKSYFNNFIWLLNCDTTSKNISREEKRENDLYIFYCYFLFIFFKNIYVHVLTRRILLKYIVLYVNWNGQILVDMHRSFNSLIKCAILILFRAVCSTVGCNSSCESAQFFVLLLEDENYICKLLKDFPV